MIELREGLAKLGAPPKSSARSSTGPPSSKLRPTGWSSGRATVAPTTSSSRRTACASSTSKARLATTPRSTPARSRCRSRAAGVTTRSTPRSRRVARGASGRARAPGPRVQTAIAQTTVVWKAWTWMRWIDGARRPSSNAVPDPRPCANACARRRRRSPSSDGAPGAWAAALDAELGAAWGPGTDVRPEYPSLARLTAATTVRRNRPLLHRFAADDAVPVPPPPDRSATPSRGARPMDMKLELIGIPVTDITAPRPSTSRPGSTPTTTTR